MAAEGKTSEKRAVSVVPAPVVNGAPEARKPAEKMSATPFTAVPFAAAPFTETGAAAARTAMEKSMDQATKTAEGFFKAAEEAAEFGRGNLEAVTKMTQTLTAGMQDLGRQYFAMAQGLTDQALESAKALAAVKSLKEAAEIQASFTRSAMERSMSEGQKLQEATMRLAEQAYAPLTARMQLAMEKVGKPLAA